MAKQGRVHIGISGWRYGPWRGVFYPPGLAQRRELEFASRALNTIEINGSFYSLQRPASWQLWHDETPDDFVFAVKGAKFITHFKRLIDVRTPLANFFASGVLALRHKLGPILWQFPAQQRFDEQRFEDFCAMLPRDTGEALALAHEHDARLEGRSWLHIDESRPLRHAFEVRHDSFIDPAFVALLRRHRCALVVADTAGRWPLIEDLSADFVYLRLHGDQELYASGYSDEALAGWATRIAAWREGQQVADARLVAPTKPGPRRSARDVFCYFDNDIKVHAPYDAAHLAGQLGITTGIAERHPGIAHMTLPPARKRATGFGVRV